MQLFLFLNDLAGRWPWVDEMFRAVYVGTVPLLATLLLARLTLFPKAPHDPPRSRVVLAAMLAVALSLVTMLTINAFASALGLGVLSPRPFMTRRINLLIVEPQDNSFPAPELMLAAVFAVALAGLGRRWAVTGLVLTSLLALARLFCGNNYLADVVAGISIGSAWAGLALSLVHAPLRNIARNMQMSWSGALLGITLLGIYGGLASQPRFASKLYVPWNSPATAAPLGNSNAPKSARDARGALQEGEGVMEGTDAEHEAEALALSKRSNLFLPEVEAFMRGRLTPRTRPFTLLDVEVAPVKAGSSAYRCAAVRFEIERNVPNLRRQVVECAARLVKLSFALDSRLQNVDIIAILRGDGKTIDGSDMKFIGDEVPVFTASIQRKNLVLSSPSWANSPKLDGGSWLRFRSRLFVNERVLPVGKEHQNEPVPQPLGQVVRPDVAPSPKPVPFQTPALVRPSATPKPQVTPQITPQATRPAPPVRPLPAQTSTSKPTIRARTGAPRRLTPQPKTAFTPKAKTLRPLPGQTNAPAIVPTVAPNAGIPPIPEPKATVAPGAPNPVASPKPAAPVTRSGGE